MPNLGPFPSQEGHLDIYFKRVVPYVIANATRLLLTAANEADLNTCITEWNILYPDSRNDSVSTKTIVQNKNTARDNLIALLRRVYGDIPVNVWTVEDRNTLNLPAKKTTRTPAPVPLTTPIAQIHSNRRLQHKITYTNEDGSLAKPYLTRGCQIWYKIGDAPADPTELTYLATPSVPPYLHHFDGEHAGKQVCYWLRWENSRGKTGPWSSEVRARVNG